jgi:hypothetical protein
VNIRETMYELDCGCGCHLEGKDAQCLIIKFFLHLEAAHPEIEEPTIELTEEMVTVNLTTQVFPPQTAESRSHERAYPSIRSYLTPESSQRAVGGETWRTGAWV